MQILTVILSSAVIASIVSIVLGYVFENKRYIKDKKILIYTEFLEQLDKMFPAEEIFGDTDNDVLLKKMKIEASNLEKYIWKIKLISQNQKIHEYVDNLFTSSEQVLEFLSSDKEEEAFEAIIEKSETLRDELITAMNKDINTF